jgi:predicted dehydrogenase
MSSLGSCPQAATVALCEIHPQRAREATQRYKIPRCYSDYRELLEQPDIDAVIVALPNCLHAPVAQEALQARKHVLVEKPMATNFRDAAKTAALAVKMKRTLMVAQKFRLKRQTQIARSVIQRGELGEIYHARSFWLRRNGIPRIGSWFTQKQMAGGGCLCDLGVHMLDTGLYLLGDFAVTAVCGQIHARFGPRGQGE